MPLPSKLPDIQYTARDFATIKQALSDYITATRPEVWSDFFESNIGMAMIDLVAYIGDVLSFAVNRVGEEAFGITARRYKNILKYVKWVGYTPRAQISASVTVKAVDPLPTLLATNAMVLSSGERIKVGDMTFETLQMYSWPAGTTEVEFDLAQGETRTDSFTSDGTDFQQLTTQIGGVIGGSWKVTVDGVEWEETDFITLVQDTNHYETDFTDDDSKLVVGFGDGVTGNKPALGSIIEITYRAGSGAAGNIPAGAINHNITAQILGNPVTLRITNESSASGGEDRETLEHIQRYAPLYVRTVDKAITKEDYNTLATLYEDPALAGIAKAVTKLRGGALIEFLGNNPGGTVVIPAGTVFNIGSYEFKFYNDMKFDGTNMAFFVDPNSVDVHTWVFNGTTFVPATPSLKASLLGYLEDRSVVTVTPFIKDGSNVLININLGDVTVDARYDLTEVGAAIDEVIQTFFTRDVLIPGDSFILSDFYNVVENVPGVNHFVIQSPTADIAVEDTEMIVKGVITKHLIYPPSVPVDTLYGRY